MSPVATDLVPRNLLPDDVVPPDLLPDDVVPHDLLPEALSQASSTVPKTLTLPEHPVVSLFRWPRQAAVGVTEALSQMQRGAVGLGEAAVSTVGSLAEFPLTAIPTVAGVARGIIKGPAAGIEQFKSISQAMHPYLVYEPQTDAGKAAIGVVHEFFDSLRTAAEYWGQKASPLGPAAQTAIHTVLEGAPAWLAGFGVIKAKIAGGQPLTPPEQAAFEAHVEQVSKAVEPAVMAVRTAQPGEAVATKAAPTVAEAPVAPPIPPGFTLEAPVAQEAPPKPIQTAMPGLPRLEMQNRPIKATSPTEPLPLEVATRERSEERRVGKECRL